MTTYEQTVYTTYGQVKYSPNVGEWVSQITKKSLKNPYFEETFATFLPLYNHVI